MPFERGHEGGQPVAGLAGRFQYPIAQRGVGFQKSGNSLSARGLQQVGLVEQDDGLDIHRLRCHQVAVDQVGMGFGQRCYHDDDLVHVGGHGFQFAERVRPQQFRVPWLARDNNAVGLAGPPNDAVPGDQALQVGAEVAAMPQFAGLHQHLGPEVRYHQPLALGAQLAAGQRIFRQAVPVLGALAPLFLDLLHSPGLAPCQLSLAHWRILAASGPFAKLRQQPVGCSLYVQ